MRLVDVGTRAVLAEVESSVEALALYAAARREHVVCDDVVPGARTVLFDGVTDEVRAWLASSPLLIPIASGPRTVVVPTTYDGPDLAETAALLGMSGDELVARHRAATFTVAFCGFAPGFAYCTGLGLDVPRLDVPRTRVEPGSVGLAGEFTGVYPSASPGGWRIIGHTDVRLWDATLAAPALLTPGTTVRFVP